MTCTRTDGIINSPSRFGLTEAVIALSAEVEGTRVREGRLGVRDWWRGGETTREVALGWLWLIVRVLLPIVRAVNLTPMRTPSLLHFVLRPLVRVVARVLESRTSITKSSAAFRTIQPMDWVFRPLNRNTGRENGSMGAPTSSDDS